MKIARGICLLIWLFGVVVLKYSHDLQISLPGQQQQERYETVCSLSLSSGPGRRGPNLNAEA